MSKGAPTGQWESISAYEAVAFHEFLWNDAVDAGQTTKTVNIAVPAGTWVGMNGVGAVVTTHFDGAGAALTVGVSYNDTTSPYNIAQATLDTYLMNSTSTAIGTQSNPTTTDGGGAVPKIAANAEVGLNGFFFATAGNIKLVLTPGTGGTKGRVVVKVRAGFGSLTGIDFTNRL